MAINLDTRVSGVAKNEGFAQTINPAPFVNAFNSTIQTGQQLQALGGKGSAFAAQQATIENDNFINHSLLEFEQEKSRLLLQAKNDPEFRAKHSPSEFSRIITDKLNQKQSAFLAKIPQARRATFQLNTGKSILAAQATAAGFGLELNNDRFKANALTLRQIVMDGIANPNDAFDLQTAKNAYISTIRKGVVAGVYDEDDGVKLLQAFEDEASLTQLDREELALVNGENVEDEAYDRHIEKIMTSPLDPKDKTPRVESFEKNVSSRSRKREAELARVSKQVEDDAFSDFYLRMPNPDREEQSDDVLTQEELRFAAEVGIIRDPAKIKDLENILREQEKLDHFPDGFDVKAESRNIFENIKSIVLDPEVFPEDAEALLDAFERQVNDMHQLAPFDLTTEEANDMLKDVSTFRGNIRDRKFRLEEQQVAQAKKDIRFLIAGDPLDKRFENVSPQIVVDAQNSVEMLVRSGVKPSIAVEDVMGFVSQTDGFANDFEAGAAEKLILKKYQQSSRSITDEDRLLLRRIIKRRAKNRAAAAKGETPEARVKRANQGAGR